VTTVVGRAPGKVVLTGEYAVLRGAPAVVAAIDRHAEVRVRLVSGGGPLAIESRAEGRRWVIEDPAREPVGGGDLGAVLAAWRVASPLVPALAGGGVDLTVGSEAFLVSEKKLGLGRSAATVSAATAAFLALAGRHEPDIVRETALAAHALFQEERGSGADVAAAVHGGVVEFRRNDAGVALATRRLPPGLQLLVGWTGESMATAPLLARFDAVVARREPPALAELCVVACRAAAAVAAGDTPAFLAAVTDTSGLLDRLGRDVGIPIVTPTLARLVAVAERAGAAAKPSGAGGGDCGIAFATSPAVADRVRTAWQEAGIVPLALAIAPGASVETGAEPGEVALG
jgi:phosphomevalonate kinase